ncbi:MAG: sodium:calcium antiporter [candidate division Zixibacteria bacterium]|nr:sodium:calcium antiporter [candidate division Zixibacteria bacterium]
MLGEIKELTAEAAKSSAWNAIWTFPSIIGSALVIAWGAESAQFLVSQGFALTMLALIQTLPEFAVEGVIAWRAGQVPTPENIGLATANFTGALRLLVGLGWPLIYTVAAIFSRRSGKPLKQIVLDNEHSVELIGLFIPTLYMFVIVLKASLNLIDSAILICLYLVYVSILLRLPPKEAEKVEETEPIPRYVLGQRRWIRNSIIWSLFLTGAIGIYVVAGPFLESMLGLSIVVGVPTFVFIQWVAPFLSEFPEKVSAFYWAKTVKKSPMSLMNMVSSGIAELTLLVGLIPIVYCISRGGIYGIEFDFAHRIEILLTAVQSLLGFLLLANMRFRAYEAAALFILFAAQFVKPTIREEILFVYVAWIVLEIIFATVGYRKFHAFGLFVKVMKKHILKTKPM